MSYPIADTDARAMVARASVPADRLACANRRVERVSLPTGGDTSMKGAIMATSNTDGNTNQTPEEQARIALALEMLAEQERKDAEKAVAKAKKAAEKAAKGEQPNAAHAILTVIVRALRANDVANAGNPDAHRAYVNTLAGFVDTAAQLPNVTTATDFRVIGQLIETTMPKVPVVTVPDATEPATEPVTVPDSK